ncbi:MAG: hypothetical protein OXH83_04230, partial [Bryobacterales bacterium]|nr:hypothetical protein [Bryobacterales bacterium]
PNFFADQSLTANFEKPCRTEGKLESGHGEALQWEMSASTARASRLAAAAMFPHNLEIRCYSAVPTWTGVPVTGVGS